MTFALGQFVRAESPVLPPHPTPFLLSGTLTNLGRLSRCLRPFLAAHSSRSPTLSTTPGIQEGLKEWE